MYWRLAPHPAFGVMSSARLADSASTSWCSDGFSMINQVFEDARPAAVAEPVLKSV